MSSDCEIGDLLQPGRLQTQLEAVLPRSARGWTAVALACEGEVHFAAVGAEECGYPDAAGVPFRPGCITKLFVATLIASELSAGTLRLDDRIGDRLDCEAQARARFGDLSVRQLLDHTHGLDESALVRAPLAASGRIDLDALCAQLAPEPLYPPGQYYSYSAAGSWILGAILEAMRGTDISRIVRDEVLDPLGIRWDCRSRQDPTRPGLFCAASGGALLTTLGDLMKFVQAHLERDEPHWVGSTRSLVAAAEPVQVPGLSTAECGVRLGWKTYGAGWLGHNAMLGQGAALLRLHPQRRIGFAIASASYSPISIALTLFGRRVPSFVELRVPKLLQPEELFEFRPGQYLGTFSNAATALHVQPGGEGRLLLSICRHDAADPQVRSNPVALRPAPKNLFFFERPQKELPFVQFIGGGADGLAYVWDGNVMRRRTAPGIARSDG